MLSQASTGDDIISSRMEKDIVTLVNFSRLDPLTVAQYLEVDTESLFSGIETHDMFWSTHKWSLKFNQNLSKTAISHCLDMFDRDYFASDTPEGEGPEQRALKNGYRPEKVDEYLSVFAMTNYIPPEKALFELFKQFFIDEVEAYKNGRANIFDYRLKDLGVSFRTGKLTLGGKPTNVYVLSVIFGISEDNPIEEFMMRHINTARNDYIQALDYFGVDKQKAAKALDGFVLINLNGGLAPLVFYSSFDDFQLQLHQKDDVVYDNEFEEIITLDWEVNIPKELDPNDIALILFENLLHMENMEGVKAVFNFRANIGAINLERIDADEETSRYKVIFKIGTENNPLNLFMGNLFAGEKNENPFSRISGLGDIYLVLYNEKGEAISSFITGSDGSFRLSQEPGLNTWEAWSGETLLMSGSYESDHQSYWCDIVIPRF